MDFALNYIKLDEKLPMRAHCPLYYRLQNNKLMSNVIDRYKFVVNIIIIIMQRLTRHVSVIRLTNLSGFHRVQERCTGLLSKNAVETMRQNHRQAAHIPRNIMPLAPVYRRWRHNKNNRACDSLV